MVVHIYNPSTQEVEAGDCCKFEASLSYTTKAQGESLSLPLPLPKKKEIKRGAKIGWC